MEREINIRRATIQEHLRDLAGLGFVAKFNNLWHVTDAGRAFMGGRSSSWGTSEGGRLSRTQWLHDRAHNIKIKCEIISQPKSQTWLKGWKKNDKLKNNVFFSQKFGDVVLTYTKKSIIFQLPPLKFPDSNIALAEAGHIGIALIHKLENEVEGLRLGGMEPKAQVISQHHAIPNHPYSRFLHNHGISYKDELIDIDASASKTPEIEFTDCENSNEHFMDYAEVVKQYIRGDAAKPKELTEAILVTQKQISEIANGLNAITQIMKAQFPHPMQQKKDFTVPNYIG